MTLRKRILFLFLFMCQFVSAQNDSITNLNEVVVSDTQLKKYSSSQTILEFNDSIIRKNQSSLSDLLNYNSIIYFKQYGRGMLSTVSMRGTTSSQTAVIWNGININSQLNGSTDFNTITSNDFNSISIKPGGGSVIYGSGAIGGTVHLNNDLSFKKQFANHLQLAYGSFNTLGVNYNLNASNGKWSTQLGFSQNSSTNDYLYLNKYNWKGEQQKNLNGEYTNTSLNVSFGYKMNENEYLKFYSQNSNTDRNLSLVSESETKTKYINSYNRNLLDYSINRNRLYINTKLAYIQEIYKYFGDIDLPNYSFGRTDNFISKLDLGFQLLESLNISAIIDYNHTKGYGTSFGNNVRQIASGALLVKHKLNNRWLNELGIRKENTINYKSPWLFSIGSSYVFSKYYSLKVNASRNFRIPTFNDLYWETGGNPNLKPESSYQAEVGNIVTYRNIKLTQTVFYNKIKDLLRWVPGNNGFWSPQNEDNVDAYGSETLLGWENYFNKHHFSLNGTYAYTISKNIKTNKQLFFVPFHKATGSFAYGYKRFSVNYQFLYNGFVYTRSDNDPKQIIKAYKISNFAIDYDINLLKSFKLGFQVLNLLNQEYQSLEDRPFPGRNFNININLKF